MPTAQEVVDAAVIRGGGCAMFRPATPASSGQVTGAGTDMIFSAITDTEVIIVISNNAAAQEFIEILLDHGVNVQFIKLKVNVDGTTGAVKEGGEAGEGDQVNFTIAETDLTMFEDLISIRGTRGRISVPLGEAAGSVAANTGWAHLFGQLSGNISRKTQGENVVTMALSFTGVAYTANGAGDTAIGAAGSEITPLQGTPLTPPAVTDLATLKKGQIVTSANAE